MSLDLNLTITDAGKAAIVAAQTAGVQLVLAEIAIGDANNTPYVPDGTETALVNEKMRVAISAAGKNGNQFNVQGNFVTPEDVSFNLYEIYVITDDDVVFAVWSNPTFLTQMYDGYELLLDLYFAITSINPDNITFVVNEGDTFKIDGSVAATADISLGGHKLTHVAPATEDTDAPNKSQLDVVGDLVADNVARIDDVDTALDDFNDDLAIVTSSIANVEAEVAGSGEVWEFIASQVVTSSVTSVEFTNLPTSGYIGFKLIVEDAVANNSNTNMDVEVHTRNAANTGWNEASNSYRRASNAVQDFIAQFRIAGGGNVSFLHGHTEIDIRGLGRYDRATTALVTFNIGAKSISSVEDIQDTALITVMRMAAEQDNGLRIKPVTNSLVSGKFSLYGIKG